MTLRASSEPGPRATEHGRFDPDEYAADLLAIVREIQALPDDGGGVIASDVMEAILRRHPR
nr:hypothetical protein [Myxococcota bacterium]